MFAQAQQGLLSTYRQRWRRRGLTAWLLTVTLLAFYLTLYFTSWLDPLAARLGLRNKWFLYGFFYSAAMVGGAVYYLRRHGNARYNRVRITVNLAVQILLAFCLPFFMRAIGRDDYYFSYLWPLKIEYLYPNTLAQFPVYIALYSALASLVAVPVLTILYGKRWYCSWVCGCGALANTFGDPWRHLSLKSTRAWRFELVTVHSVLAIAVITTVLVALDFFVGAHHPALHRLAGSIKGVYGFVVGAILAGIVGVVAYPLLGPRVWCRYFCPMAALLGMLQKAGRFRINVKPDMCISCGNCSAYCEMGIDVRAYAQNNQDFTRAACVGCGMCAHVCPRGVLRLESRWRRSTDGRRQGLPVVDF